MNKRNIENGLAIAGALLVLLGVTAAASSALADEVSGSKTIADEPRAAAEQVTSDAAREAAQRIANEIELDLDIRFLTNMSEIVASAD